MKGLFLDDTSGPRCNARKVYGAIESPTFQDLISALNE